MNEAVDASAVNGAIPAFLGEDLWRLDWRCVNIIRDAIYQLGGRALCIAAVNLERPLTAQFRRRGMSW